MNHSQKLSDILPNVTSIEHRHKLQLPPKLLLRFPRSDLAAHTVDTVRLCFYEGWPKAVGVYPVFTAIMNDEIRSNAYFATADMPMRYNPKRHD